MIPLPVGLTMLVAGVLLAVGFLRGRDEAGEGAVAG